MPFIYVVAIKSIIVKRQKRIVINIRTCIERYWPKKVVIVEEIISCYRRKGNRHTTKGLSSRRGKGVVKSHVFG